MAVTLLRRHKVFIVPAVVLSLTFLYYIIQFEYHIRNTLNYATRPLWDNADGPTRPSKLVPHYHAEGLKMAGHICHLHRWDQREPGEVIVLDTLLVTTNEMDLLEIRMNELTSVVDYFLIAESNITFDGVRKETYFADNRQRFSNFDSKIEYLFIPGYTLEESGIPLDIEGGQRYAVTNAIHKRIEDFRRSTKILTIMSEISEIPASHTIALLKSCDFGRSIHLQMRNFLYSFEWYFGLKSWQASVHLWGTDSYYRHAKSGERILAESGWHCTYCFRTIADYMAVGQSRGSKKGPLSLDPKSIQDTICHGKDLFGMFPEAYSYADLFSQMSLQPLSSAFGLPRFVIDNAPRFRYLLPGGCMRQAPPTPAAHKSTD